VLLLVALWMGLTEGLALDGARGLSRERLYCGVQMMSPMLQPDQPEDCVVVEARVLRPNGRGCP